MERKNKEGLAPFRVNLQDEPLFAGYSLFQIRGN